MISKKADSIKLDFGSAMFNSMIDILFYQSPDAIIFANEKGKILFWNKKAKDIFGYSNEEIIGKPILTIIPQEFIDKHQKGFDKYIKGRKPVSAGKTLETKGLTKQGEKISIELSIHSLKALKGKGGSKNLFFVIIRDISKRVKLQQKLFQQSITDPLTGLYNRRYFDKILKSEFERSERYKRSFSVIVVDIDGFKQVNDLYGHSFGDEILIKAKDVFEKSLRKLDSAYRYGGDEFGMILPETPKEGAMDVAERVRGRFIKKCKLNDRRIRLSLSIGLASFPEDGKDENSLIGAADRRMYHSKGEGGNHITGYTINELIGTKDEAILRSLTALTVKMEENRLGSLWSEASHSQKIRTLAMEIGRRIGLTSERVSVIEQASMFHDIGMLYISKNILLKTGKLARQEKVEIRKHPLIGEEIIDLVLASPDKKDLKDISSIVGQHHEWFNGQGYPRGLKGEDIFVEARILHTADTYEAMMSDRPYRKALKKNKTIEELKKNSGTQFDPRVVKLLLEIVECSKNP